MQTDETPVLYQAVADDVCTLISSGTLEPGARVPSVRRMSRQRRVSVATVLQAYHLLENRGLIEARPQSGYYVRVPREPIAEPDISAPPRSPQLVGVHALVDRVLESARRPEVVPLGAAIPSPAFVPTVKLRRAISGIARREASSLATYSLPPGREELRRQIALHARDLGAALTADEIIVTNGCVEAINLCLRALTRPGDVIALESPTYFGLLQIIESLRLKALEIPTHPRNGISLDALADAIERKNVKACIVMPNVSNPLGSTMSEAAKKRLVRLLEAHDVPLIEDSVYSALHFSDKPPFSAKAYDRKGLVMLCSSYTKTLAPGLRVGWVAPGRYYRQVRMLKFISSVGVSDMLQLTIAQFLENGGYERVLRGLRRTYARQVELFTHAVCRHFPSGTKVTRPSGGYVLWVELPSRVDSVALYERALAERIGLAPGSMFSASNRYRNCLRLNCAIPWSERIEKAIARVGAIAAEALNAT